MSTRANRDRIRRYVAALHAARRQLAAARLGLAKATRPEGPLTLVEPKWRWAHDLLEQRRASLLRTPGVIGVALGSKVTKNADTSISCVTVFVVRKRTPASLQQRGDRVLPRLLRAGGRTLPVDVVALGRLTRQAFASESCSVTNDRTRTATIGAPAIEIATSAPVFITAMHVTGRTELDPASGQTLPVRVPSSAFLPAAPVIGNVTQGSRTGIDAAKVLLVAPHAVLPHVPEIGPIRGWRPLTFPGDKDVPVRMFGAVSRVKDEGLITNPAAFMPEFGLDSAIVVRGLDTTEGDSGAALFDAQNLVLGFLVGTTTEGQRIFCPASLVLQRLKCDIPIMLD